MRISRFVAGRWAILGLVGCGASIGGGGNTLDQSIAAAPEWAHEYAFDGRVPQSPLQRSYAFPVERVDRLDRALLICEGSWGSLEMDLVDAPLTDADERLPDPVFGLRVSGSGWADNISHPFLFNVRSMRGSVPAVTLAPGDTVEWVLRDWDHLTGADTMGSGSLVFDGTLPFEDTSPDTRFRCGALRGEELTDQSRIAEKAVDWGLEELSSAEVELGSDAIDEWARRVRQSLTELAGALGWDAPEVQDRLEQLERNLGEKKREATAATLARLADSPSFEMPLEGEHTRWQLVRYLCGEEATALQTSVRGAETEAVRLNASGSTSIVLHSECLLQARVENTSSAPLRGRVPFCRVGSTRIEQVLHSDTSTTVVIGGWAEGEDVTRTEDSFVLSPGGVVDVYCGLDAVDPASSLVALRSSGAEVGDATRQFRRFPGGVSPEAAGSVEPASETP